MKIQVLVGSNRKHGNSFAVAVYDQMQRTFPDRDWIETGDIIKRGITQGYALEGGTRLAFCSMTGNLIGLTLFGVKPG